MASPLKLNLLIVYDRFEYGTDLPFSQQFNYKEIEAEGIAKALRGKGHNVMLVDIDDLRWNKDHTALQDTFSGIREPFDPTQYDGVMWRCSTRPDRSNPLYAKHSDALHDIASFIESKIPAFTPFKQLQAWDGKIHNQEQFEAHGIQAPMAVCVHKGETDVEEKITDFMDNCRKNGGLPFQKFVVKKDCSAGTAKMKKYKINGLFGGVSLGLTEEKALQKAKAWLQSKDGDLGNGIVVQQQLPKHYERERITMAVTPDHVQIIDAMHPSRLKEEDYTLMQKLAKALGPGIWGIDALINEGRLAPKNRIHILEVNPFSADTAIGHCEDPASFYLAEDIQEGAEAFVETICHAKGIDCPYIDTDRTIPFQKHTRTSEYGKPPTRQPETTVREVVAPEQQQVAGNGLNL